MITTSGHTGKFLNNLFLLKQATTGKGLLSLNLLSNLKVSVSQAGQLGPMRNQNDLLTISQFTNPLTDLSQNHTANTGIYLIKQQRRQTVLGHESNQGQKKTGQFSTRGNLIPRLRRLAGIRDP